MYSRKPALDIRDPQGNTRDLVYVYSGTPADDHYIFMAFGNELGPVGPANNPYRYNGQWGYCRDILDRMYVQARHYDAVKGRWLSEDPEGTGVLYTYASNSSVMSFFGLNWSRLFGQAGPSFFGQGRPRRNGGPIRVGFSSVTC